MAHQNYISVANANDDRAVTVLVQYYNDEMNKDVLYYLRVIPGGGNVLVDPSITRFRARQSRTRTVHEIPGTATNVSDVMAALLQEPNDG